MKFHLIISILLCCFCSLAQGGGNNESVDAPVMDTLIVKEAESGIPFKYFDKLWKHKDKIHAYRLKDINKQDRKLLTAANQYIQVYDAKERLMLEGNKNQNLEMVGLIKFYYPNGNLKRIETWGNERQQIMYNGRPIYKQRIEEEGRWSYYRKDGTLKKEILYCVHKYRETPLVVKYTYIERKFNRKGKITSEKERVRRF